jgi:branched-chain amino acid transport system ATP-binding protein
VTVAANEITGLIGPNGAGKTTLFNVVSGILAPDEGTVVFDETDITGWPAHRIARGGITRTFQTPRPVRALTVEKNLRVARFFSGDRDGDRERLESVLELLTLAPKRNVETDQLGIVERKYVDLGRALVMEPDLVMLDEIMAGLNPTETSELIEAIREAHDTFGTDFLLIEHNLRAIRSVSDAVIVIHEGHHLATGSPKEVLERESVQDAYIK